MLPQKSARCSMRLGSATVAAYGNLDGDPLTSDGRGMTFKAQKQATKTGMGLQRTA
jgi:hypothetical protein